ncbi:MAG: hypothetical protein ACE5OZ_04015 [Candidatus Heimdallarchaeota archaeon]
MTLLPKIYNRIAFVAKKSHSPRVWKPVPIIGIQAINPVDNSPRDPFEERDY